MTYLEVAQTLEDFIEGRGGEWAWDDYLTGTHFKDPYLKATQERMNGLSAEFPPLLKGYYCGPAGIEVIRTRIQELRTKAIGNTTTE